jgi:hypothetical protein
MIIAIDTKEKLECLLNGLENNEIQLISGEWTKEEKAELSREIARRKALRKETLTTEPVLA